MKLIVNDVLFDNPERLDVSLEVSHEGESIGPMRVLVTGGELKIRIDDAHASITVQAADGGSLVLGDGQRIAADLKPRPREAAAAPQ